MGRPLIIDPRSERTANSPLEIGTEPGRGPGVYVTDHKYPDPEQEILSAGGREGKRRSGPPVVGNRQIPIEMYVMGRREDYAANLVNLATNPSSEFTKTFEGSGEGWGATAAATSRVNATDEGVDSRAGEYVVKAVAGGGGNMMGAVAFNFPAAGVYTISVYCLLPSTWDGGDVEFTPSGYAGSVEVDVAKARAGVAGLQRIICRLTVAEADKSGDLVLRSAKNPTIGRTLYLDALQIEAGETATDYFDGDSPGSSWTGAVHASTSTQPGGGQRHFEAMVADLEKALAKLSEEGGTYSRPYEAGRLVFDVEGLAAGNDGDYAGRQWIQRGQRFKTTLDCLPYGRGERSTKTLRSQTTDPVLVFTENLIGGTVRALGELEVADIATQPRRSCVAGIEVPTYDITAETAALYYGAEKLTPLGPGGLGVHPGATPEGVSNVIFATLVPAWRTFASTKIAATSKHLTHVGTFRIYARVRVINFVEGGKIRLRLEWGQGDLVERVVNDEYSIDAQQGEAQFFLVDLGLVRINKAKVGTQRWEGQIAGRSYDPAGSNYKPLVSIDDLRIVPVGQAFLKARASEPRPGIPTSVLREDSFNQTAGALNGKSASTGGAWVTSGAGLEDFQVDATNHRLKRTESSKRVALLPSAISGATAGRLTVGPFVSSRLGGLYFRYVDANNYGELLAGNNQVLLYKVIAGTTFLLRQVVGVPTSAALDIGFLVSPTGYWAIYIQTTVEAPFLTPLATGYDPVFATGGTLASGQVGIYDAAGLAERWYDNFQVWVPSDPLLIASGRRMRWRHDSVQREDSGGGELWSGIGYEGDPLLIPPSTRELRSMRGIVFPSRGDLEGMPDAGNSDDFTAQLAITARHLSVRA